jgi:gluconate 2-dehydrogenase gamma chain
VAEPITRRQFLISGSLATTGATLYGLTDDDLAHTYNGKMPGTSVSTEIPQAVSGTNHTFLTDDEADFVAAAVARLIPADDLGPGALEAGCVLFIDRQLAGSYGRAEHWYMQGPWPEGDDQQGMQSRMTPAETYRAGVRAANDYCRAHFDGKAFHQLSAEQQDHTLTSMEKGEVELQGVKAKGFFAALLQNTIEGFFADPLYGGNRDMVGWKLIGFPGARYDHRDMVDKHGVANTLPPVGILGRKDWG